MINEGRLSLPYSVSSKLCWVDYRDVAEVAGIAMTSDELRDGTFELCAPGHYDGVQVAAIASSILGRRIEATEISPPHDMPGVDDSVREGMSRMIAHYNRFGLPGGNALVLRAILRRQPRTLADYFRELQK